MRARPGPQPGSEHLKGAGTVTTTRMLSDTDLRQLVEAAPDAVIVADTEGRIVFWNQGAELILGFSAAEAIGQSLDLIIPEKHRGRHWEGYERVMKSGETKYGREMLSVPGIHRDGSRLSLEFTVALLKDASGAVTGIGAVMRDNTARFNETRELHRRIAELEKAAKPG